MVDTPSFFSIVAMMLLFGSNHFLSAAAQPPITLCGDRDLAGARRELLARTP